jgi:hypothetical protein
MNATLRCGKCGHDTTVTGLNIARMAIKCPVVDCGFPNSLPQMLENFYGEALPKEVRKEFEFVSRLKVKDGIELLIASTERIIQRLIDAVAAKSAQAKA